MQYSRTIAHSTNTPKLVYFQPKYDDTLPEFVLTHQREHVKCLSQFFEVVVVNRNCDYRQICDKYEPNLVLFETGINILTCRMPTITNVRSCPEIPKVGLINADAWCETRSGTLSELEHWDIETVFSIAITAAEHTPELANNIFVWPNCVDPDVYKDYQEHKLIPILLSGANAALYPWRQRVHELLAARYPSLSCPHPGYLARPAAGSSMFGEQYARTLNASCIAPVCGTVAKELVRKHFEIPGCKTLMVTEESPGLVAAGFRDMRNCVFADQHNVLEKVGYLFAHPTELAAIASAGYELVQRSHTMKQRDQLLQWYKLHKTLQADQKIVQPGAFEPLTVVSRDSNVSSGHIISNGQHLVHLYQGDEQLSKGRYREAETAYSSCLAYMRKLPEALLKRALCNLYQGNAERAVATTFELVQYSLDEYKAPDPDPVEWAYYILALVALGRVKEAWTRAGEFPQLRHTELDRVRRVTRAMQDGGAIMCSSNQDAAVRSRPTIHRFPKRPMEQWIGEVCKILAACRQVRLASKLAEAFERTVEEQDSYLDKRHWPNALLNRSGHRKLSTEGTAPMSKRLGVLDPFKYRLAHYKLLRKIRSVRTSVSLRAKAKYEAVFAPARVRSRDTDGLGAIVELIREKQINTVLLVGIESEYDDAARALKWALGSSSTLLEVNGSDRFGEGHTIGIGLGSANALRFGSSTSGPSLGGVGEDVASQATGSGISREHEVDLLVVIGLESRVSTDELSRIARRARFVALNQSRGIFDRELCSHLLRSPSYALIGAERWMDRGCAIFSRGVVGDAGADGLLYTSPTSGESRVEGAIRCELRDFDMDCGSATLQSTRVGARSGDSSAGGGVVEEENC